MIIWINGAFGSGKTTTAYELHRRIPNSFVYDPENAGYFIRKNTPASLSYPDFQDDPLWREFNYRMLKSISVGYDGLIIAPMTVTDPLVFQQIIGRLREDGVEVNHYILWAGRDGLLRRLRRRRAKSAFLRKENFAIQAIDRCIHAYESVITEGRVETKGRSTEEIVSEIAGKSGVSLTPDRRSCLRKRLDAVLLLLRHLRL